MGEMFSWEVHDGVTYGWTQGFPSRQLPCNVTDVNHFTCQWFECCGSCSDCSDFCVNFKLMFSWYFRFCAYLTCAVLIRLLEGFFFSFLFSIRYFQTRAGYPLCTCVRASNWSKLFFVWNENLNPSYEFAHQLCIRNKWIIKKITLTCRSSVDQSGIKNKRTKTGTLVFAVQFSFTCSLMGAVDASLSLPCAVMSPGDWSLTACCKCHFQLGLCKCEDVDHKKWICCCNTYFYNVFNKIIKTELCTVFFSE